MEIHDIKHNLTLSQVLKHYGLKADKNHRLNCPFHPDKTPSMQLYYKTQTCYCFSSNCRTHGKSLDVIDFVMYSENLDTLPQGEAKHKAILKAMEIAGINENELKVESYKVESKNTSLNTSSDFLSQMFNYFKVAINCSAPARDYIKSRGLWVDNIKTRSLEIGYNSGQFHHGARKEETLIENCLKVGLLIDANIVNSRDGGKAYHPFGKYCIVFALRNRMNQVTGFYFRSIVDSQNTGNPNIEKQKHYYLKDRQGLYPCYPNPNTEILILTEAIIDAATLIINIEKLESTHHSSLNTHHSISVLACYGTNGLTPEHITAIKELKHLKEVVFAFDNDPPGHKASLRYASELKVISEKLKVSKIDLPDNEDINSVHISHQPEVFTHLFSNRKDIFSIENKLHSSETFIATSKSGTPVELQSSEIFIESEISKDQNNKETFFSIEKKNENTHNSSFISHHSFNTSNPYKLIYQTETADYYVVGGA